MGLFSRRSSHRTRPPVTVEPTRQIPDELAEQAQLAYGGQDFYGGLQTYALAIDKIHTMCVVAAPPSSRIRRPGPQDQPILDGFINALGATLASTPEKDVRSLVERSMNYLAEIAAEAGTYAEMYDATIAESRRLLAGG